MTEPADGLHAMTPIVIQDLDAALDPLPRGDLTWATVLTRLSRAGYQVKKVRSTCKTCDHSLELRWVGHTDSPAREDVETWVHTATNSTSCSLQADPR